MDSNNEEMFVVLPEEENDVAAEDVEHMQILDSLARLYMQTATPKRGGSVKGRRKYKARQMMEGYCLLYADYFIDEPLHEEAVFRCHFRMSRKLFFEIAHAIWEYDPYFVCKKDCTGMVGFSSLQKCTVTMRLLAYGASGDSVDDYLYMVEFTAIDCLYRFCRVVIAVFGKQYLRTTTAEDTARILAVNESRGFPGMLGSIDCMH